MAAIVDRTLKYLGESPQKIYSAFVAPNTKGTKKGPTNSTKAHTVAATKAKHAAMGRATGPHASAKHDYAKAFLSHKVSSNAVGRLAKNLRISPDVVLKISKIPVRTYHRRQAAQELLTETESDRLLRIARVALEAEQVFGSSEKSTRWLSANNPILGAAPLDLLATDAGAREVEYELVRIEHGDLA